MAWLAIVVELDLLLAAQVVKDVSRTWLNLGWAVERGGAKCLLAGRVVGGVASLSGVHCLALAGQCARAAQAAVGSGSWSPQIYPCAARPRSTRRGWISESWRGRWASGTSRTRVTTRAGSSSWQSTRCPGGDCPPTGSSVGPTLRRTTTCRGWPSASAFSEDPRSLPGYSLVLSSHPPHHHSEELLKGSGFLPRLNGTSPAGGAWRG